MRKILLAMAFAFCAATAALAVSANVARELGNAFADAVEKVMPSVVVVRTQSVVVHPARDAWFGTLYGIPERLAGQGSGVILTKDGYVLTSHHVIEDAEQVEVALPDGTKYTALIIGRDAATDLAVLKIQAPDGVTFPPVEIGDSDKLRVGEFAIAIGSPFSLDSSVTVGIVSQKGRSVGLLPYEDFIQTDASINPGNSGGPLVDAEGRMIGINSMIQTGSPYSRGSVGIAFAVPANMAMRVADSIIKTGSADRPWLGMHLTDADRAKPGVLVAEVFGNTPAARCGIRPGDLILTVDGQSVIEPRDVQREVFKRQVGEAVRLDVRRGGQSMQFEIVTEKMPDFSTFDQ